MHFALLFAQSKGRLMVTALEAAGAARSKVIRSSEQTGRIVLEFTEREVAFVAEQPAVAASSVAVVEDEPAVAIIPTAEIAGMGHNGFQRLFTRESIASDQVGNGKSFGPATIALSVAQPALFAVLNSIFSLTHIAAIAALILSQSAGNIVEPKIVDRPRFATAAAHPFFHSNHVAVLASFVDKKAAI